MDTTRILQRALYLLPIISAALVCLLECIHDNGVAKHSVVEKNAWSRSITDATGHRVELPWEAQRVGTPGISMASLILLLGGSQKISALTPEMRANKWIGRVAPGLAEIPTPFSRPAGVNMESLLATKPDLVVLWGKGDETFTRKLEMAHIAVLHLAYTTPEELEANALILGQALGPRESQRAEKFVAYYAGNRQRVASALADLPDKARPRVYYASIAPLHSEGSHSMVDAWISSAGGINVAARGGLRGDGVVHMEDVLAWDPEVIVTLGPAQRAAILADPRWRNIRAVRGNRVLVNPGGVNAWCTRAGEAALQVLWAAKMFHPERFGGIDINAETRFFYREFYAYELDEDELARLLQGNDPTEPHPLVQSRSTS